MREIVVAHRSDRGAGGADDRKKERILLVVRKLIAGEQFAPDGDINARADAGGTDFRLAEKRQGKRHKAGDGNGGCGDCFVGIHGMVGSESCIIRLIGCGSCRDGMQVSSGVSSGIARHLIAGMMMGLRRIIKFMHLRCRVGRSDADADQHAEDAGLKKSSGKSSLCQLEVDL